MTREDVTRALADHRLLDAPTWHCRCNHMALSGYRSVEQWEAHLADVLTSLSDERLTQAEAKVQAVLNDLNDERLDTATVAYIQARVRAALSGDAAPTDSKVNHG